MNKTEKDTLCGKLWDWYVSKYNEFSTEMSLVEYMNIGENLRVEVDKEVGHDASFTIHRNWMNRYFSK